MPWRCCRFRIGRYAGCCAGISARGRPSNRHIAEDIKAQVLGRVQERYPDFGPTPTAEHLRTEGFRLSKETLRRWMIEVGFWQAKRPRAPRGHPPRPRRVRSGEWGQIDGSAHDWFEGRASRCCLIALIDDATSRVVMAARFVPVEGRRAYLSVPEAYVTADGCPAALSGDRHGLFTKHDPEDAAPSPFQRATGHLGIATIQALTPQAKGRVERLFQTLQDRLVKAMRLAGLADIDTVHAWRPESLAEHNARFALAPFEPEDAHRPYEGTATELARICVIHHPRTLSKDLVVSL